jgi:hypothetical protein
MSKTFTITVYSDPGHGWGKVKRSVLEKLHIAHKISCYSYQLRDNVYLEEDCDLALLFTTLNEQGVRVKYIEKTTNSYSRIRNYDRYKPF